MADPGGRPIRHRLLGAGLIAYGVSGLLILTVLATGVLSSLDRIDGLFAQVDQQRRALASAVESASLALASTTAALAGIDSSLSQARTSAQDAVALAESVSGSMATLGASLNVTILGTQPFAAASSGFTQAGTDLKTLADRIGEMTVALGSNGADVQALEEQVGRLQRAVDAFHDGLQGSPGSTVSTADLGALRLGLLAFLAWLALQAAASAGVGAWLLARGRVTADPRDTSKWADTPVQGPSIRAD